MDITFVTPSYSAYASQESIGTLILAKKVRMAGYTSNIVRFWEAITSTNDYSKFRAKIIDLILRDNPRIASFYCRGEEYHIILDIACNIKLINPTITILLGGPHAELTALHTMKHYNYIDYISCGEGENTIIPILNCLLGGIKECNKNLIPGLVFRNNQGQVIKNQNPELLPDGYSREFNYYDLIPANILLNSKFVTLDVGRGCPFSCFFCSTKTFWKQKYRLRNIYNILEEIDYVKRHYGDKVYSFSHDLFTANNTRIIAFCDSIDSLGYPIRWTCSSRIDCINKELIDRMVASGLVSIYYGIETGSQSMQKKINKNLDIKVCTEIIAYSIKRGLSVTTSFIYGFPEETKADLNQTLVLMHLCTEMGADVQIHRLQFEPGTKIFEKYRNRLRFDIKSAYMIFGIKHLEDIIKTDRNAFSSFWDFSSNIREEMKLLGIFHSILKIYPKAYTHLFKSISKSGFSYYEIYKLFFNLIDDTLYRFEKNSIKLYESISTFVYLKIIHTLNDTNMKEIIGFSKSQMNTLTLEIESLLKYKYQP